MSEEIDLLVKKVYDKTLASSIQSIKPINEIYQIRTDGKKILMGLNYKKEEYVNYKRPITEEVKNIIYSKYKNAGLLNMAFSYEDKDGIIYVNDGGTLSGCIYKIDKDKNVTIIGRK